MSLDSHTQHPAAHTMDSHVDDPQPTPLATNDPFSSRRQIYNLDVLFHHPFNNPGMGLPFELWGLIISFLALEPYPLLACCLTCHSFYNHANDRLRELYCPALSLDDYTDLDHLVHQIRTIPGRALATGALRLTGRPALAFSTLPHRLASQCVHLHHLQLVDISEVPNVPSSTWILYGHAFSSVVSLFLTRVQFPSFMDFVRFITSFHALEDLKLEYVSCTRIGAPPSTLRSPLRPRPLKTLSLFHRDMDGGHFVRSLIPWFSSRGGLASNFTIDLDGPLHPLDFSLLQTMRTHLHFLTLYLPKQLLSAEYRRSWRKYSGE